MSSSLPRQGHSANPGHGALPDTPLRAVKTLLVNVGGHTPLVAETVHAEAEET